MSRDQFEPGTLVVVQGNPMGWKVAEPPRDASPSLVYLERTDIDGFVQQWSVPRGLVMALPEDTQAARIKADKAWREWKDEEARQARARRMAKVVVIGSYREDLPGLMAFAQSLRARGMDVLHPPPEATRTGEDEGFVRLSTDPCRDEREVQCAVFQKIRKADLVVVWAPSGRVGASTALEIGYALHAMRRVVSTRPLVDPTFRGLVPDQLPAEKEAR